VIFENARDLLIVDAHSKPSAAAALVAQLRREVTQKPIRYIVNTHFHWDHSQGDATYRRLAPGAELVTSNKTRELLSTLGTIRAHASSEGAKASLDDYHHRLEAAKTAQEKQKLRRTIAQVDAYIAEMQNYQPELPDITFDSSLVIHEKERELHLAFRGRGHTSGDVVVFSPQSKVVATGDLLHGWFPFIADGYPREWPKTLATLNDFPFETVVGGHGQAQKGNKRLRQMANYIGELAEAISFQKAQGRSPQDIQSSISPDSLPSLDEDYRTFLVAQNGEAKSNAAGFIASNVKTNIAEVYARLDEK
jgi:cyclase